MRAKNILLILPVIKKRNSPRSVPVYATSATPPARFHQAVQHIGSNPQRYFHPACHCTSKATIRRPPETTNIHFLQQPVSPNDLHNRSASQHHFQTVNIFNASYSTYSSEYGDFSTNSNSGTPSPVTSDTIIFLHQLPNCCLYLSLSRCNQTLGCLFGAANRLCLRNIPHKSDRLTELLYYHILHKIKRLYPLVIQSRLP